MRIGLTTRITQAIGYDEPRDSLSQDWTRTLTGWNATPIPIPNGLESPKRFVQDLAIDLIVLTGGDDPEVADARHRTETALADFALADRVPLIGVCRGMQFLNLYFGGRLVSVAGHTAVTHDVEIIDPEFERFYGKRTSVNSYHDVGVKMTDVAAPLIPTACCDDMCEAFRHPSLPIAAIMWHPERTDTPDADRLLFTTCMS